jgi:hypothetical protein
MLNQENDGSQLPPAHDEVGYQKPPMYRRFKKSGKPSGRPKGSKNRKTIVKEVAKEMHVVRENGKRRKLSTLKLVLFSLRNMALEGKNVRAFDEFHRLIKAYQPQATTDLGYLVVPAAMTPEEWMAEQREQNKHRKRPSGCKS